MEVDELQAPPLILLPTLPLSSKMAFSIKNVLYDQRLPLRSRISRSMVYSFGVYFYFQIGISYFTLQSRKNLTFPSTSCIFQNSAHLYTF